MPTVAVAKSREAVELIGVDQLARTVRVSSANRLVSDLLTDSANVQVDKSGKWLAYSIVNSTVGAKTVSAGPAGGPYEVIAVGVVSYRWHEARSGILAVQLRGARDIDQGPGFGDILLADFASDPPALSEPIAPGMSGALDKFGDWGFSFDLGGSVFRSRVVDSAGSDIVADINGFATPLDESHLLLMGYVAKARLLDLETVDVQEIDWFETGDTVLAASLGVHGETAMVIDNSFTSSRQLVIADGTGIRFQVMAQRLMPVVAWSRKGQWPITIRRKGLEGVVERWMPTDEGYEAEQLGVIDSIDMTTLRPLHMLVIGG